MIDIASTLNPILSKIVVCLMGAAVSTSAVAQLPDGWDGKQILTLVDADMAATAYANGKLYPIDGTTDELFIIDVNSSGPEMARVPVSNTVMGWPGSMVASEDGRFLYTVTSRQQVEKGVQSYDDGVFDGIPIADVVTMVEIAGANAVQEMSVCKKPMSVDIAPSGDWLLVACGDPDNEVAIVPITDAGFGEPRTFDIDVPSFAERDIDGGATYGVVHPGGNAAALILNNRAVTLLTFDTDADGIPMEVFAETPTATDRWLAMARWTQKGDHLLVADTGWGPRPLDAAFNKDGYMVSFALSPDDDNRGVVSRAQVSKSPESFELNRNGDLAAVVNMERTYLPGDFPTGLFPGRKSSSLSLVKVDDKTGTLTTLGDEVDFRGVLPEDAGFDSDGDRVAVVVYQDHGDPESNGWITFFAIEGEGDERIAVETGDRIPLPRGGHDLIIID